jgi:hypothetical protein
LIIQARKSFEYWGSDHDTGELADHDHSRPDKAGESHLGE